MIERYGMGGYPFVIRCHIHSLFPEPEVRSCSTVKAQSETSAFASYGPA